MQRFTPCSAYRAVDAIDMHSSRVWRGESPDAHSTTCCMCYATACVCVAVAASVSGFNTRVTLGAVTGSARRSLTCNKSNTHAPRSMLDHAVSRLQGGRQASKASKHRKSRACSTTGRVTMLSRLQRSTWEASWAELKTGSRSDCNTPPVDQPLACTAGCRLRSHSYAQSHMLLCPADQPVRP